MTFNHLAWSSDTVLSALGLSLIMRNNKNTEHTGAASVQCLLIEKLNTRLAYHPVIMLQSLGLSPSLDLNFRKTFGNCDVSTKAMIY